ncbi:MAG: hypothetical protein JXA77_09635 [Bacteroidales bacterium]|nr:hypothetical protein [Bacteroidales bacterium]MBN2818531.1 hypothetical protein [Bacteroidales bacterium]
MILRLFRENQTFTLLFTLLYAIFIWLFNGLVLDLTPDFGSFYHFGIYSFIPSLSNFNKFGLLTTGINVILIFITGVYLNRITVKYQVIRLRSNLPLFMFFVLSTSFFITNNGISFPLLTVFILLIIVDMIFSSLDNKAVSFRFFDSSLLIAIASLIHTHFVVFYIFILFIWIQYRLHHWRELVFIIFGAFLPYFFLVVVFYLAGSNLSEWKDSVAIITEFNTVLIYRNSFYYLTGFLLFMFLATSGKILQDWVKMKINVRKYSLIFLTLFITAILITLIFPVFEKEIIFFFALPLSFLFAYYFASCRITIFNQVLFVLLIVGSVLVLMV